MITGTFKRNDRGRIVSIEVTGHAGFGDEGEDIICASISTLAYSVLNSIDSLAGFQPIVEINEVEGGYLYAEMLEDITQEQINITQILLESLLIGFKTVKEEYSDYITIRTINNEE
ncbi:ribosomal-processing cysteine protease Prp [Enterococcus sp. AZ163]|uniref:ribosomal-processing cysteine protease Prp n=1 Tax=Enterococcus sp. AZ163 TaxID=2774638 RepID=UPI003D2E8452